MSEQQEVVSEWLHKAENDFTNAKLLYQLDNPASYDLICYLSQQCIEKMMKAILIKHNQRVSKIHDLMKLSTEISLLEPDWSADKEMLQFLTSAVIEFRYPGDEADYEDASQALEISTTLRNKLLTYL